MVMASFWARVFYEPFLCKSPTSHKDLFCNEDFVGLPPRPELLLIKGNHLVCGNGNIQPTAFAPQESVNALGSLSRPSAERLFHDTRT